MYDDEQVKVDTHRVSQKNFSTSDLILKNKKNMNRLMGR